MVAILNVAVDSPRVSGSLLDQHIDYRITSTIECTNDEDRLSPHDFAVYRRYRDFDYLRNALLLIYPGVIVPPLPPKTFYLSRHQFGSEVVERRRAGLERFLKAVTVHPVLRLESRVLLFLEAESMEAVRDSKMPEMEEHLTFSTMVPITFDKDAIATGMRQVDRFESRLKALLIVLQKLADTRQAANETEIRLKNTLGKLARAFVSNETIRDRLSNIVIVIERHHECQPQNDLAGLLDLVGYQLLTLGAIKEAHVAYTRTCAAFKSSRAHFLDTREELQRVQYSQSLSFDDVYEQASAFHRADAQAKRTEAIYHRIAGTFQKELGDFDGGRMNEWIRELDKFVEQEIRTKEMIVQIWEGATD